MIRGQKRPLVDKTIMASIHNRFDIEVVDAKTGVVKQRAQAENVILSAMWSNFTARWFDYIAYGSGQGNPSTADTALFKWVGAEYLSSANEIVDESHVKDGYVSYTRSASLPETAAVGVTITEVGLSRGSSSTSALVTHAMLKDMNGNPIGILKTDTDIINLYATVFFHWDLAGYNSVELAANRDDIFPIADNIGSSYFYFSKGKTRAFTLNTYVQGSYNQSSRKFSITCPRLTVSQMNYGGFQYVGWGPYIAKIAGPHRVTGESVGTGNGSTVDFATKFDFPSNATVYVDGVVATNVTVSEEPLCYNDLGQYFHAIHPDSTDDCLIAADYSPPASYIMTHTTSTYYTFGLGTYFNPYYDKYGIDSYTQRNLAYLEVSNDLVKWETVYNKSSNINKSITPYRNYKYWRTKRTDGSNFADFYLGSLKSNDLTGKNIHFDTPPASGAIITIDYDTPLVPKDENHVYDFNLQVQVGAYSEN